MNILIIHPFFTNSEQHFRGSEFISQNTYKILKENGHVVRYFATDEKPYIDEQSWTSFFPKYAPKFNLSFFWNFEAQRNMNKLLNEFSPDIVHIHGLSRISYSCLKPVFDKKIPTVMTIHDPYMLCPAGKSWDNEKINYCTKCSGFNVLPCVINNCVTTKKWLSSVNMATLNFFNKSLRVHKKINRFITPSLVLKNFFKSELDESKIDVVPNFVNSKYLMENPDYENNKNCEHFIFVGTLTKFKGVDTLLNAMKILPDNIKVKIIGSGAEENRYKNFVKENKLTNVTFLGSLNQESLIKEYKNALAVIVPSLFFETFGLINVEAFALGKTVIGSNIAAIPEIIEDGVDGLLFNPDNAKQLSEKIRYLYNNKQLTVQMGKKAREKVEKLYTEEIYYKNLMSVYEKTLFSKTE